MAGRVFCPPKAVRLALIDLAESFAANNALGAFLCDLSKTTTALCGKRVRAHIVHIRPSIPSKEGVEVRNSQVVHGLGASKLFDVHHRQEPAVERGHLHAALQICGITGSLDGLYRSRPRATAQMVLRERSPEAAI